MSDTPREAEFRMKVRELLARGIKPNPTLLCNMGFGQGNKLSGSLSVIRREEFAAAGWVQDTPGGTWRRARR